jgi:hypothetical protein
LVETDTEMQDVNNKIDLKRKMDEETAGQVRKKE